MLIAIQESQLFVLAYIKVKCLYPSFFQIPSREVDKGEKKMWTQWNPQTKQFFLQFYFKENIKEARLALKAEQNRSKSRGGKADKPPPGPPGYERFLFLFYCSSSFIPYHFLLN